MKLRKIGLAALAAVGIASVPAQAQAQLDNRLIETVGAILLADKLGIDPSLVMGLVGGNAIGGGSASLFDLAPILLIGQQAGTNDLGSLSNLLGLRSQGLGWDVISDRAGLPPDRYQQLRSSGQLDNNNLWRDIVENNLQMGHENVQRLRNMGFTWRDVAMTSVISRESGRSLSEVANRYRATRRWGLVARHYGVTQAEIQSRITAWRSNRTLPTRWRTNTTRWSPPGLERRGTVPPGLAKKGGMPLGQRKKNR